MSSARKLDTPQPWQLDLATGVNKPVDSSCVGISDGLEPDKVLDLALNSGLNHVCQKKGHAFNEEVSAANCMIQSPDSFFNHPIATILSPENLSDASERALLGAEYIFNCSTQKLEALETITNAMNSKGLAQTIVEDIMTVGDEMFTNAIFNAPFVDLHTQKNPGVSRSHLDIQYEGGKHGRLFLAHDEKRLLVGCQDPYGSLSLNRYLKKIHSVYEQGPAATINFGPGGAGIGSYIIFNVGASLYFGVWPGRATIMCCVVPLGLSNRTRMGLAKHIHWIQR